MPPVSSSSNSTEASDMRQGQRHNDEALQVRVLGGHEDTAIPAAAVLVALLVGASGHDCQKMNIFKRSWVRFPLLSSSFV